MIRRRPARSVGWRGLGVGLAVTAVGMLGAGLDTAVLPSSAAAAQTLNCVAGPDATNQTVTVPAGATAVTITAAGAQGGAGSNAAFSGDTTGGDGGAGADGGSAIATFAVTPGEVLTVNVGCQGGAGTSSISGGLAGAAGTGGVPDGSSGTAGGGPGATGFSGSGGGGGASEVHAGTTLLVVGGGGGGGGGGAAAAPAAGGAGGSGGFSTGAPGDPGANSAAGPCAAGDVIGACTVSPGNVHVDAPLPFCSGGGGGTQTASGTVGTCNFPVDNNPGTTTGTGRGGTGGAGGGESAGGGAGGGLFGGGGGGGQADTSNGSGGGGGGGASFLDPSGLNPAFASTQAGNGTVTLTFTVVTAIVTAPSFTG